MLAILLALRGIVSRFGKRSLARPTSRGPSTPHLLLSWPCYSLSIYTFEPSDLRDSPRDPRADTQHQTAGSRTDQPPGAPEPAEEDMDLFVQKAGPSQTVAEGTGDGGQPEYPTNPEEFDSRQDERERRRRKKLERKKRREARREKKMQEKERLEREQERERLEREQDMERLGDGGVGKSALAFQFTAQWFSDKVG
jgi:hypothetical protein